MRDLLSSREAAAALGVGTSTIKRWSDDGVLPCVKTEGGHRRFRADDVDRLLRAQAGRLREEESATARLVELLISEPRQPRIVAALLDEYARLGSWFRVADALANVLVAIGRGWERGELTIAEEHIASERLGRALAWLAQSLVVRDDAPTCLLLTAEGDEHTHALSLAELCAREAGFGTLWLGRRTPLDALSRFLETHAPAVVAVSASASSSDQEALARQYQALAALAREHGFLLVLGGAGPWPEQPDMARRMHRFEEWSALLRESSAVQLPGTEPRSSRGP
jgi:excisionase family DNA binding protein